MTHRTVRVLEGGRGSAPAARIFAAVTQALDIHRAGGRPDPLFVVAPGTDRDAASAEAEHLGVPETAGLLMRTSGSTTGTGKIVALSWDNLVSSARATEERFGGAGAWLAQLPYHHIAGFQTIFRSALAGVRPLTAELTDADEIRRSLAESDTDVVYFSLVPTQLAQILASPDVTDALRPATFLVGGQGVSADLLARGRTAGLSIATSYGMTETCGGCVYDGVALANTTVHLGDGGRIELSGDMVGLGYLGGIDPNAWRDTSPRTHVTKDVGQMAGGRLNVLGRADDAITTGGLTIMPSLIEDEVTKITGLGCVVVPIPDERWGEAAIAVVDGEADEAAVRAQVKANLGPGWAPTRIVHLTDIGGTWPLTDSGKINRTSLRERVRLYLHG